MRLRPRLAILVALFFLAPFAHAQAVYAPAASHTATVEAARAMAQAHIDDHGLPGLAIAVAIGDEVVWSEGLGYADLEQRVPIWPTTKFRIASISKPLAAAAVARLVDEGRLDVDAPVQTYVPYFPEKAHVVTTRQLGGHLGGIRHYRGQEMLLNERFVTVEEGIDIFKDDALIHPPGSAYAYSSYGWNLISAVVEGASGQDFLTYMREQVFAPLGMHHTVADHVDSLIVQRARPYVKDANGHWMNAPAVNNSYKWAGGGFLSTVEDLIRFAQAHHEPGVFSQASLDLLFTPQRTTDGEEVGYGFGWQLATTDDGRSLIAHNGGATGGATRLVFNPNTRVTVALLINQQSANLSLANDVLDLFEAALER
ncbi:MAG: serine hydrolase domain-containing protein [Rhodothermales bacterium]